MQPNMSSRKFAYDSYDNVNQNKEINLKSLILRSTIQKEKFQESINSRSLKFKDLSTEDLYQKYYDKNCEDNHFGYNMILAIEVINLILELIFVCVNHSSLPIYKYVIWIIFKLIALALELLSIFHHKMECIEFLFDIIPFFTPSLGDFGFTILIKNYVSNIFGFITFICFTTSIQFIFVIYTRFRNFIPSLISFIISLIVFYLSFDLEQLLIPSYELIRVGGFLGFLIICVIFMYNLNANQRKSFFDLFSVSLEFMNQKGILASIPFSIIVANRKEILYLNKATFELFKIPRNNIKRNLSKFTVFQKNSSEKISLLHFLKNDFTDDANYYCYL